MFENLLGEPYDPHLVAFAGIFGLIIGIVLILVIIGYKTGGPWPREGGEDTKVK